MERLLLEQNQCHLQQTKIEGGTSDSYPMPQFRQSMGMNTDTDTLLKGRFTTDYEVPPPVAAWIKAVTQTDCEKAVPDVVGSLSKAEFQQMFRHKKEGVSSDPHGPWNKLHGMDGNGKKRPPLQLPLLANQSTLHTGLQTHDG